ncbi:MFS transporter [Allorhizobium undicola]|uniref:MFS transporter n=1 Tax=Allorhizobium undicola TaxID=78527 RepID=UPI000481B3CF|nr:MFS transporter [Allorhizobium undicola]
MELDLAPPIREAPPNISATFGGGISWLQWIVDAYALTFASLLLSGGFLTDRFGARTIYLLGIAVFAAASLACGLAGMICGPLAVAGFILVERRAKQPLIPMEIFGLPLYRICLFYGFTVNFTYYGVVFIISLYLQKTLGFTPMQAGYAYLPLTATFFLVNMLAGTLVGRFGPRAPMIGGALLDAFGFLTLLALGATAPFIALILPFMLIPAGMGTGVPAMTTAVLENVPPEFSGVAIASINAARQAAGAMGVAVFGMLAGNTPAEVHGGLHKAALISIALLLLAAIAAMRMPQIRARPEEKITAE